MKEKLYALELFIKIVFAFVGASVLILALAYWLKLLAHLAMLWSF